MWGEVAKASYDPANIPDYASSILGPMRSYYTSKEREDKELLSANVEVSDSSRWRNKVIYHKFQKRSAGYNAFEKDIAIINIFFGDATAMGEYFNFPHILNNFVLKNMSEAKGWPS